MPAFIVGTPATFLVGLNQTLPTPVKIPKISGNMSSIDEHGEGTQGPSPPEVEREHPVAPLLSSQFSRPNLNLNSGGARTGSFPEGRRDPQMASSQMEDLVAQLKAAQLKIAELETRERAHTSARLAQSFPSTPVTQALGTHTSIRAGSWEQPPSTMPSSGRTESSAEK